MTPRLLLRGALSPGYRALDAEAVHYLRNVLRLGDGDRIEVFNGAGARCPAEIVTGEPDATGNAPTPSSSERRTRPARPSRRQPLALELKTPVTESPAPTPRILLAFGLLKGQATDEVLRKATELGATDLLPVITERTQQGRSLASGKRSSHWGAVVAAAAAQCHQDHLPTLQAPVRLQQLLEGSLPSFPLAAAQKLLLEPTGQRWPADLSCTDTALLIGPEGGWSANELAQAAAAGWRCTRMGDLVLRAETAPLAALSWVAATWAAVSR